MQEIMSPQDEPQRLMSKDSASKDGVVVSSLPNTFDIDLEKGEKDIKHSSFSSCETLVSESELPLPRKKYSRTLRHARHTFLNVYRRLFSIVFVLNLIGVGILYGRYRGSSPPAFLADMANAASANIMVALLVRQDYVVNALFRSVFSSNARSHPISPDLGFIC